MRSFFVFFLSFTLVIQGHAATGLNAQNYALTELVVTKYSRVHTPEQFIEAFAGKRPQADKAFISKSLHRVAKLPLMKRSDNGFTLSLDSLTMEIDFRRASEGKYTIHGETFTVQPSMSIQDQTEMVINKLQTKGAVKDSALFRLLVPEAHAIAPFIAAAIVVVATAIANKLIDRYGNSFLDMVDSTVCWLAIDRGSYKSTEQAADASSTAPVSKDFCKGYKKEKEELLKKTPANVAVANATAKTVETDKLFKSVLEQCPFESKNGSYKSVVSVIPDPSVGAQQPETVIRISAEFEKGVVKGIKVFDVESNQQIAKYNLDAQQILSDIIVPNPDVVVPEPVASAPASDTKKGKAPVKANAPAASAAGLLPNEITISAVTDLKDKPSLQALQTLHKSIFAYVGSRLTVCKAKKQQIDADKASAATNDKDAAAAAKTKAAPSGGAK